MPEIWTIGHSNRSIDDFLSLLTAYRIECIADVRRFPMSRRHPHFGIDSLRDSLRVAGISYRHISDLGGRRTARPDSNNSNWKNEAFRGYADYMESKEFADAVAQLQELASQMRTTVTCAEALWWQ